MPLTEQIYFDLKSSYGTILRAHVGAIMNAAARGITGEEVATVGCDRTIRIWDVVSGQQKFEFTSTNDQPLCSAFHPLGLHVVACGFESGSLRVFDVDSTTTVIEHKNHNLPIMDLIYAYPRDLLRLFTASLDGLISVYDAANGYAPLKSIPSCPGVSGPFAQIIISVNFNFSLLAVATSDISTISVYDTVDLTVVYRGGSFVANRDLKSIVQYDDSKSPLTTVASASSKSTSQVDVVDATSTFDNHQAPLQHSASCSMTSPVKGLAFIGDAVSYNAVVTLLICTDKYLIALHMDSGDETEKLIQSPAGLNSVTNMTATDSNISVNESTIELQQNKRIRIKKRSVWEKRLVRRIDFGVPAFMKRDPCSGLLLFAVQSPSSSLALNVDVSNFGGEHLALFQKAIQNVSNSSVTTNPLQNKPLKSLEAPTTSSLHSKYKHPSKNVTEMESSLVQSDAIAIADVKLFTDPLYHSTPMKLSMSKAQLYSIEHLKEPLSFCACTPCGKMVSVDSSGCLAIWNIRTDRMANLQLHLNAEAAWRTSLTPSKQNTSPDLNESTSKVSVTTKNLRSLSPSSRNSTPAKFRNTTSSGSSILSPKSSQARTKISPNELKSVQFNYEVEVKEEEMSPSSSTPFCEKGSLSEERLRDQTRGLTADFELTVSDDPSAWSVASHHPKDTSDRTEETFPQTADDTNDNQMPFTKSLLDDDRPYLNALDASTVPSHVESLERKDVTLVAPANEIHDNSSESGVESVITGLTGDLDNEENEEMAVVENLEQDAWLYCRGSADSTIEEVIDYLTDKENIARNEEKLSYSTLKMTLLGIQYRCE
jgi:hypothetical protein